MAKHVSGALSAKGLTFAIVAARFNELIVDRLVIGAVSAIERTGGDGEGTPVYWVPGAYELPQLAQRVAKKGGVDAIICLGAVIRGATPHFDYVCSVAASGVSQVALAEGLPVTFGVLTCDTIEQATERAGTKAGNKGFDVAMAAIEMANQFKTVG